MADATVNQHKIMLDESEMPTQWYNIIPDLPEPPPPPLHPGTLQPVGPEDLMPLFPMDLILQEVTGDRYVDIPGEVLDVYRQWRPSPLFRAHRLEKALGTPEHTGSLGIAISEAVEVAAQSDDTKYALGSVLNHVLLHQTIIGEEALLQLA